MGVRVRGHAPADHGINTIENHFHLTHRHISGLHVCWCLQLQTRYNALPSVFKALVQAHIPPARAHTREDAPDQDR